MDTWADAHMDRQLRPKKKGVGACERGGVCGVYPTFRKILKQKEFIMSKIAKTVQVVEVCCDCMFSHTDGDTLCTKMMPYKISENSMNKIPKWCPLPDK